MSPVYRVALYGLTAACWIGAFIATHRPIAPIPGIVFNDKLAHFAAYCVLSVLLTATLWAMRLSRGRALLLTIVVCLTYGVFDELTQIPVGRSAEVADWIADAAGTLLGAGVMWAIATLTGTAGSGRVMLDSSPQHV